MPGITSADIKYRNRGSVRETTVNIKAYNKTQFNIIDLLYLRLGYTVLLEWGWAPYIDNSGNIKNDIQFYNSNLSSCNTLQCFFSNSNLSSYYIYISFFRWILNN